MSFPRVFQVDLQNRRRLFWQAQVIGWGLLIVASYTVLRMSELSGWAVAGVTGLRTAIGMGISCLLLRPALRWARRRTLPPAAVGVAVAIWCAGLGWSDTELTESLALLAGVDLSLLPRYLDAAWIFRGIVYLVWCLLYYAIHSWLDAQESRLRLAQLQAERRMVELRTLQAQVNPHFLFNAFNSILAEAENPKAVISLTEGVAEFLRFSLRQTDELHALGEELDALEHYLRVEKTRFEDRFEYTIAASEPARRCRVPGALVQPLVENAIKYGQRTSPPPLCLGVEAVVTGGELVVTMTNTGCWVAPQADRPEGGIGLANLQRRLALVYGESARCDCAEAEGSVRVVLRMPTKAREVSA